MALNKGFATDGAGRRLYFPPVGQPRLVPSREAEARFNEIVFFIGFIAVVAILATQALEIFDVSMKKSVHYVTIFAACLAPFAIASLLARRWQPVNDSRITYGRFVVNTFSQHGTAALIIQFIACALAAIGLVALGIWLASEVVQQWSGPDDDRKLLYRISAVVVAAFAWLATLRASRVVAALRRQRERAIRT